MPNFKAFPTGTIVGDTDTQTLSNKTLVGTATNDNAATGNVGEHVTATLVAGSATSLVTGTAKTIISISLTAGDWDVKGTVSSVPAASTSVTQYAAAISTTNNAFPSPITEGYTYTTCPAQTNVLLVIPTGTVRLSLASTTTVYLVADITFTVSTATAYGTISARRVR